MTPQELAARLGEMHSEAKGIGVILFGILYAQEIENCGASRKEIVRLSRLRGSAYDAEVGKGVRLARYVIPRPGLARQI